MKVSLFLDAIAAATTAGRDAIADRIAGRDPARRAGSPIAQPDRLAGKLIDQQKRGQRP